MNPEQKYRTPAGFRAALEERLNRSAKGKGMDIMRLRRPVAFDRLLSRLFAGRSGDLILKGGYALELQLNHARTTKDIDFSIKLDEGDRWASRSESEKRQLCADLLYAPGWMRSFLKEICVQEKPDV
jgi:hypothetical protein